MSLSFGMAGLAIKNLARNRFRVILTVLGVAVAIVTFVLLRTIVWAWTSASDFAAKDRIVTRHKITFVMSLPKRYIDDVRSAPHIKEATYANWFGGKDPAHDREFFGTLAIDVPTYFKVYPEVSVPPDQMQTFVDNRKAAIVGDVLAKKLGWKVGDHVTIQSGIYGGDWLFDIVGIYTATSRAVDRSTFLFHWEYLNDAVSERRRDQIGWIVSRVDDPSHAADVSVSIDRMFDEKEIQTLSQDERSFNASFLAGISAVLKALNLVSGVILVIMMLVLGNTIAMGVRERTSEYGVLRAIGFLPKHVVWFIVAEAMAMGVLGGALGLAVSYPFVEQGLGRWLEENMGTFFPYFRIPPVVTLQAMLLAVLLAGAASVLPARRASRLNVVDALRRVA